MKNIKIRGIVSRDENRNWVVKSKLNRGGLVYNAEHSLEDTLVSLSGKMAEITIKIINEEVKTE